MDWGDEIHERLDRCSRSRAYDRASGGAGTRISLFADLREIDPWRSPTRVANGWIAEMAVGRIGFGHFVGRPETARPAMPKGRPVLRRHSTETPRKIPTERTDVADLVSDANPRLVIGGGPLLKTFGHDALRILFITSTVNDRDCSPTISLRRMYKRDRIGMDEPFEAYFPFVGDMASNGRVFPGNNK